MVVNILIAVGVALLVYPVCTSSSTRTASMSDAASGLLTIGVSSPPPSPSCTFPSGPPGYGLHRPGHWRVERIMYRWSGSIPARSSAGRRTPSRVLAFSVTGVLLLVTMILAPGGSPARS